MMDLRCIVHVGSAKSSESIKKIDDDKWKKLLSVVTTRKTLVRKTKYDQIIADFPEQLEEDHGYHSKCYKNFTAMPKVEVSSAETTTTVRTRSSEPSATTSSTGVLPRKCIFCRHVRSTTMEYFVASVTIKAEVRIREVAHQVNDIKLLSFIGHYLYGNGPDFCALEAKYHHSCRRNYLNKGRAIKPKTSSIASTKAFNKLFKHIRDSVLVKNKPERISSLHSKYKEAYLSFGGDESDIQSYTSQNLCKRIRSKFNEATLSFCLQNKNTKSGSIVFKPGISAESARSMINLHEENENDVIRNCAGILRRAISHSEKNLLKTDTAENVTKGEVDVPNQVNYFFNKLYSKNKFNSKRKKRLVASSAADAVYCASGSKLLPGKHVGLGLALKSLTGSKRVINLLNRNGHCASNETLRRIDMDMEESASVKCDGIVPDGISKKKGRCTGTAWDNLDINMETINGLGTMHHTYGIIYQNISDDHITAENSSTASLDNSVDMLFDHFTVENPATTSLDDSETNIAPVELETSGGSQRKFKKVTPKEIMLRLKHTTRSPR